MSDPDASDGCDRGRKTGDFALLRAAAACVAVAASAAAVAAGASITAGTGIVRTFSSTGIVTGTGIATGAGIVTGTGVAAGHAIDAAAAALAALVALAGMAIGYRLGRAHGGVAKAARMLMLRVGGELSQYRAFTRLLRDQGGRIVEITNEAATAIVGGLAEMETAINGLRLLVERGGPDDIAQLPALLDAIGAPVIGMLSQLQFQDVTRQQIAFVARLSLILDDHMRQMSDHLEGRGKRKPVAGFSETFEHALEYCVMDSQRDDHHTALGLAQREDAGSKLELF